MVCPLRIVLVFLSAAIFACGVFRFARFGNEEEEEPEEQDQDQLDGEEDGRRVNQSGATSQDSHDRRRGVLQEVRQFIQLSIYLSVSRYAHGQGFLSPSLARLIHLLSRS